MPSPSCGILLPCPNAPQQCILAPPLFQQAAHRHIRERGRSNTPLDCCNTHYSRYRPEKVSLGFNSPGNDWEKGILFQQLTANVSRCWQGIRRLHSSEQSGTGFPLPINAIVVLLFLTNGRSSVSGVCIAGFPIPMTDSRIQNERANDSPASRSYTNLCVRACLEGHCSLSHDAQESAGDGAVQLRVDDRSVVREAWPHRGHFYPWCAPIPDLRRFHVFSVHRT